MGVLVSIQVPGTVCACVYGGVAGAAGGGWVSRYQERCVRVCMVDVAHQTQPPTWRSS